MTKTLAERFWSKVQTTPTCWIWTGSRNPNGYGILSIAKPAGGRTTVGAHRVAYELLVGPIAHELDHLCRVRHCVNPAHMEVVTRLENVQRSSHGNQTHCKRGHPLSGDNLKIIVNRAGQRRCRICARARWGVYSKLRKAHLRNASTVRHRRADIFERDGYVCQLCGEPIDMTIKTPDPGSASIDHIIPVCRGGTDDPENVHAAHLGCNFKKGRAVA
jgi:5-methylcytosine-specific restriction endonuclease McrA